MSSPQDARTRRKQRKRRALKNERWEAQRAEELTQAAKPKTAAKKAT